MRKKRYADAFKKQLIALVAQGLIKELIKEQPFIKLTFGTDICTKYKQ